jgi:hypothetical protein
MATATVRNPCQRIVTCGIATGLDRGVAGLRVGRQSGSRVLLTKRCGRHPPDDTKKRDREVLGPRGELRRRSRGLPRGIRRSGLRANVLPRKMHWQNHIGRKLAAPDRPCCQPIARITLRVALGIGSTGCTRTSGHWLTATRSSGRVSGTGSEGTNTAGEQRGVAFPETGGPPPLLGRREPGSPCFIPVQETQHARQRLPREGHFSFADVFGQR